RDQDRVFEVVTAPRHEGHQDITSQCQLALIGARTVCDDLSLHHAVALADDRFLVDAGVLVRALELGQRVDVAAHFTRELHRVVFTLDAHDDALRVHRVDEAVAASQYDSSRITRRYAFHAGAHDGGFSAE